MKRANKYIELKKRVLAQEEKVDRFYDFYEYDPKKAETWEKKVAKTYEQIERLENKLTEFEKEYIENAFQCVMF